MIWSRHFEKPSTEKNAFKVFGSGVFNWLFQVKSQFLGSISTSIKDDILYIERHAKLRGQIFSIFINFWFWSGLFLSSRTALSAFWVGINSTWHKKSVSKTIRNKEYVFQTNSDSDSKIYLFTISDKVQTFTFPLFRGRVGIR